MSIGYGRGYYGSGQLAQDAPRKKSWFKIVAVLGVGAAAVWFLWPRKAAYDPGNLGGKDLERPLALPSTPTSPLVVINTISAPPTQQPLTTNNPPVATGGFLKQLEDDAHARNFLTVKDYEDSVIASAKQLQAIGAKVILAPHLQHLAPQLEPDRP